MADHFPLERYYILSIHLSNHQDYDMRVSNTIQVAGLTVIDCLEKAIEMPSCLKSMQIEALLDLEKKEEGTVKKYLNHSFYDDSFQKVGEELVEGLSHVQQLRENKRYDDNILIIQSLVQIQATEDVAKVLTRTFHS